MKIFSLKKILSLIVIATMLATFFSPVALAEYINPNDSPLLYSEDFSKWTPSQDVFDSKELSELSGGNMTADGTSNFKLSADGGLTAYKPMGVSGYGISARMAFNKEYTFDELESEIEVNIDVKKDTIQNKNTDGTFTDVTADEGGQRSLGFYYNKPDGSLASVSIIKMNDLGAFMRATGNGPYYGGGSYSALPNSEGYYSLKIVLEKDQVSLNANGNATGDLYDFCWVVRVYDRNNNNAAVYSHRYLKSNEGNTSYVELPSVAGVCISTYQPGSSSAKSESRVTIKNPVFKLNVFEAVTPSTNIISANAKKLEVEFTKNVDPDTADENTITLTDPDGNNMVTAHSVKDNIVTLSLDGIVHNSSYTLNILEGLKSTKNSENVIPARFYFESTIENQTTVLFNQDFSTWNVNDSSFDTKKLASLSENTMSGTSVLSYSKTADGGLIMRDQYPVTSQSAATYMEMSESFTYEDYKNELVFDFDIKPEALQIRNSDGTYSDSTKAYGGYRRFGVYYTTDDGNKYEVPFLHISETGSFVRVTNAKPYYGTPESPSAVYDANGYASLRIILSKEDYTVTMTSGSQTYNWVARIYDRNNNNEMIYAHRYHAATTADYTILPKVEGMFFSSYQPAASRSAGEVRFIVRNPRISVNAFYAIEPTIKELDAFSGSMNVTFTKDVDPATINKNTLALMDSKGNNVATGYRVNGKTVTILYNTLTVGEKYSLYVIPGVMSTENDPVYTGIHTYHAVNIEKLFEQDFSAIPDGLTYTPSEFSADINPQVGAIHQSGQKFAINNATLNMVNSNSENEDIAFNLKKPVASGMLTAYLKIKAAPGISMYGTHCRTITVTDSNGVTKELVTIAKDGKSLIYSYPAAYTAAGINGNSNTAAVFNTSDLDNSRFIDIKIVLSRMAPDEKWNVAIYDANSHSMDPKIIAYLNAALTDVNSIGINLWRDPAARQSSDGTPNTDAPIGIKSAAVYRTNDSAAGWGGSLENGKSAIFGLIDNTVKWKGSVYAHGADNKPVNIYLAAYDAKNALLGTKIIEHFGFSDIDTSLDIDKAAGTVDHAKVMIWDENLTPLVQTLEQTGNWSIPSDYAQHIDYFVECTIGSDIDSTKMVSENFRAVSSNTNTEIPVKKVTYSPLSGLLRIYFSGNISDITDTVYVTSSNLTKLDKTPYNYTSQRALKAVVDNRTEDFFISDISASNSSYSVRVINSSAKTNEKNLVIFGIVNEETVMLHSENIILEPFTSHNITGNIVGEPTLSDMGNKLYAMVW